MKKNEFIISVICNDDDAKFYFDTIERWLALWNVTSDKELKLRHRCSEKKK